MRERLIELISQADEECKHTKDCKSCSGYGKGALCMNYHIADHLIANGVVCLPCKVGDLPDRMFSHNSIIAIWIDIPNEHYSQRLWRGMAWDIPKQYSEMKFKKIFGTIAENISESDTINILVDLTREEAKRALKGGE